MATEPKEKIPLFKLLESVVSYEANVYANALNVVQGITLYFLILEGKSIIDANQINFVSVLRGITALIIMLVIWHSYVSEGQYFWAMSFMDTIFPFSVGIAECLIIFSINSATVPHARFIVFIMLLAFLAFLSYHNAHVKKQKNITKRLYESFYQDAQFVSDLLKFLKAHDSKNIVVMLVLLGASLFSLMFDVLVLKVLVPERQGIVFLVSAIVALVYREVFHGFDVSLKQDKNLSPYFYQKGE